MATYKGEEIDLRPTETMAEEAQRGLDWRKEHGRGGTAVGVARARQLVNREELSPRTVRRMVSYFARHEVDKQGEGFSPGEDGFPSAGRIAWALWGGNSGKAWAEEKDRIMDGIDEDGSRALEDEFSDATLTGLKNKVEEHNEEHGSAKSKRVTLRMLAAVYKRGIGAFKTNPASVRPSVSTPEQWAMARVNSFLYAVRNGKFRSGKHDTDLLPEGHPMKTEAERGDDVEERHIQNVEETDDAYIITFGKAMTEIEESGDDKEMDERPYHDDEEKERIDRADLVMRAHEMDEKAINADDRTVRVGVSSEEPVKRNFGMEVIDHSRESMNLDFLNSGRAPLLLDHDMERQIGVVQSVELDEDARRLRAVVRFGKGERASEVFDDVADGIRQNISVGYRVDGRVEREGDHEDIVRVRTTPMEISIVSIPADQSSLVGVGRSSSEPLSATPKTTERNDVMSEVDLEAVRQEAAKAAQKGAKEIMSLARKHNRADLGEEAIGRGVSVDEFRGELLQALENQPLDTPVNVIDAPVKEKREYSLGRMVQAQISGDWRNAGFEREMNDEIARRVGREAEGIYVPDFAWQQRGPLATGATGATGSEVVFDDFVPTVHRGDMFIEALRARQVLSNLGTTYLSGLTSRIKMPKLATGANAAFVEELGDVADGAGTDGGVTLQPRTMGAFVDMSRLLMLESVPAIEQIIRNDLLASAADRMEFYAIQGSGSSGQPTGILNTSGINDLDISSGTDVDSMTWADVINLVELVEEDNGIVNQNAAGFLSNPNVKAALAQTAKVSSTDSVMILNDPWNQLYGYPIEFTSNVPNNLNPGDGGTDASAVVFGDFSQLMIAQFGAPSILVDPYTNSRAGSVRLVLHAELDVGVRNAVSFAVTNEVSTA